MIIKVKGYSPEGFEVSLERDVSNIREALDFTAAAAKMGITAVPTDGESRKEETIVTVVRREHVDDKGTVTPVVDFYPAWKGDYGQFRFAGVYLNTEEDIAQFEARSGLQLTSIPLYNAQVPLQRKAARVQSFETKCRPFVAHKQVSGEKEIDGVMQKVWKFAGYGDAASPDAPTRPTLPAPGQMRPAVSPSAADRNPLQSRR